MSKNRAQAPAPSPSRFSYRRLEMAELPLLNQLYNEHYQRNRPLEEAEWLYARNPSGNAVIYAAFDEGGRLAGMRPSIPFRLWWRGEERLGYEFADALVDARHQGKGIFSRLVRMTCDWAKQEGHTLFTLPNRNSLAVYQRTESLHVLGASYTRAKPIAWIRYLRHQLNRGGDAPSNARTGPAAGPLISGATGLRPVERFESDFGEVHAELKQAGSSFTLRTRQFLQWRYFGSPVRKYHVALVEERGQVRGYLVIRLVHGIAQVLDVFIPPQAALARHVFRLAARWAQGMGAIGIHFSVAGNSFLQSAAARSGFWIKKRSRNLVMDGASTQLLAQSQGRPVEMRDVYFVMGDFDFL